MRGHACSRALLALAAWAAACTCGAQPSSAGAQLAADRGCYNCHADPPRRNVPSFRELAGRYAAWRGQLDAAAEQHLVDRLHHGSLLSHIAAHERLQEDEARALVRWLVEGGR
ncbi:MAG: c-type cytochrome [Comamonadaceae bacterium]|nr:MAG: c-type cytochrome [Comamonadaceae bacterium]